MSIQKTTVKTDSDVKQQTPKFLLILENKFKTWTKIEDVEVGEALRDVCGDTFFELRKMTAQVCRTVESSSLEEEEKKKVVTELKTIIDDVWRGIIDKQKVGVDKLGIVVRKYVK